LAPQFLIRNYQMILTIDRLVKELADLRDMHKIVVTSGGFDPLHIGHVRCIQDSASIACPNGILVVIVNGDGFLIRKKGKPFMLHQERMEIIDGLRGVDYVTGWDDGSQTVVGALELLMPNVFTKGGDRSIANNVPEVAVCEKIGCRISYGVGGIEKIQSSTNLISGK
jgi:D-beta-D-heptose 7-phosphate kinase/D-beta-D-heptose 1-phosphate adenosyltransferase